MRMSSRPCFSFLLRRMDTFVMQHTKAREEERDYFTCWQRITLDSSHHCPCPLPSWKESRRTGRQLHTNKCLSLSSSSVCLGLSAGKSGSPHQRLPGSWKANARKSKHKKRIPFCTGKEASKNTDVLVFLCVFLL